MYLKSVLTVTCFLPYDVIPKAFTIVTIALCVWITAGPVVHRFTCVCEKDVWHNIRSDQFGTVSAAQCDAAQTTPPDEITVDVGQDSSSFPLHNLLWQSHDDNCYQCMGIFIFTTSL